MRPSIIDARAQYQAVAQRLRNTALEYAIRRGQVNQDGLKLNGTHHPPAYADDINM